MATNQSVHAWIVTVQSEVGSDGQPHYFYRLGASDSDLVSTLRSAGFQLAPDRTPDDDGLVSCGSDVCTQTATVGQLGYWSCPSPPPFAERRPPSNG